MEKFIGAEALLLKFQEKDFLTMHDATYVARTIEQFPAAPVRREVHAAWEKIEDSDSLWRCTNCDGSILLLIGTPKENEYNGCPFCLATMDAKGAEG